MTVRFDAMTARNYKDRDGNEKTAWTRIGTMWQTSKGWRLNLDALPIPSIGDKGQVEVSIVMFPPKEDARQSSGGRDDSSTPF